jgi:hypothetical protein
MKILFLMESPEYLRCFDSVIEALAARGHQVSLGVGYGHKEKAVGLEGLAAHVPGVRVIGVVPHVEGMWADVAFGLRGVMDFVRYLHPRFAAASALRARIKRKVLPSAYSWLDAIPRLSPGVVRRIERGLMALERAIPLSPRIVDFLRIEAPDVLLVSPLVASGSQQVDWIKAAKACGIRTAVCVASWDNLTNKGLLRIETDRVIVWNDAQKQEACDYHYIPIEKVAVTGAQLFDRWFIKRVTCDRAAFCERVGLPDARPFLLFTGSSEFISRSDVEVRFVRRWIETLRRAGDPGLREINILVRPHPYNIQAWATDPVADLPGVSVFPRHRCNPLDEGTRADFYDSLYHCAAVVGVNTSAMIEATILGKPVFSMRSEEFASTQEGTIHFHHLLPEQGGFLRIASGVEEHVQQLSARLPDVESARAEAARFVASFVRPHGRDRPATPIFVEAVEGLASAAASPAESPPLWSYLLRPILVAGALVQVVANAARPPRRIPGRRRVSILAHRVGKAVRRGRKAINKAGRIASERVRRRTRLARKQWQKMFTKPLRMRW